MAPINFEKDIKEKVNNRRLEPSKKAWDNLSHQLDVEISPRHNTRYWRIGLAASVAAFLFYIVSHKQEPFIDSNKIISQEVLTEVEQHNIIEVADTVKNDQEASSVNHDNTLSLITTSETEIHVTTITQSSLNNQEQTHTKVKNLNEDVLQERSIIEEQKIKSIVAQVEILASNKQVVTDADIEALLKAAEQDIALSRLNNEQQSVDANALLQEVEEELDQSFRTRVFEAIKAKYNTVKTAVAQRNE
ncbi:hypothetical protein KFZ70_08025 [Tamlana fucoidanivorans]|uniref:Uncharacterized protein n=1 Tax=Allotamlana fucoidanivorans TaxID=2583814 RepID=A0A5C4SIS3_9FLAO|nr:hypothetical protein [Tamlana fucoidanivorans]TNJ43729.1 hypothetical protein FGF67_10170 [Tamlana fucoidanivorans]